MSGNPAILAPSILAANHAQLAEGQRTIVEAGLSWVHLDIMDGHFVPNLSFGPKTVADLRKESELYFDTHLMLDNPQDYIEAFAKAGSQNITIHVEPDIPVEDTLKAIRALGCHCGISLNPGTPIEDIQPFLELVDLVLIMTVQPGFGGQSFREDQLPKIKQTAQWREEKGLTYRIQVDGGVDATTGPLCKEQGADTLVAGTAFFKAEDKEAFITLLQE
tara:strand:- start:25887 stop:26543 length:657 start_codon:yes stop_codon:yes gene_type:complete